MMRWLVIIGVMLVLAVAGVLVAGLLRPAGHVASTRSTIEASPAEVWAVIADWDGWAEWQPEVQRVERLADHDGNPVLLMTGGWGAMKAEVVESDAPRRMVTEVDGGAFGGRWTYELERSGEETVLTITEEGRVSNPFFRGMMVFHDNYATMLAYHRALGARLGAAVQVEKVDG